MGISKGASVCNMRFHLTAIGAVLFATALHPSIVKAQGTAAPTDPQIVGIVETRTLLPRMVGNQPSIPVKSTRDQHGATSPERKAGTNTPVPTIRT
jgi:hypothetical protein